MPESKQGARKSVVVLLQRFVRGVYMGEYLTVEGRARCFKGWCLWAAFGPWKWTKVKDVKFESEFSTIIRELIATGKGRGSYFKRLALADEIYFARLAR